MTDAKRMDGHWWLPNQPKRKFWGTLTIEGREITLRLTGEFADYGSSIVETFGRSPHLVHGLTTGGKYFTLLYCTLGETQSMQLFSWEVHAQSAVIGTHLRTPADMATREMYVRFTHLEDWFRFTSVQGLPSGVLQAGPFVQEISKTRLGKVGPFRISLTHLAHWGNESADTVLHQRAIVRIRAQVRQPFDAFRPVVVGLRNFFTLATSQQVHVTHIGCRLPLYHMQRSKAWRPKYPTLDLVGGFLGPRAGSPALKVYGSLFFPRHVKKMFSKCLSRWLDRHAQLEPVYNLYWQAAHTDSYNNELRFLLLAQALETYHRRSFGGSKWPKDEWKARKRAVVTAAPEEERKWLGDYLAWANELTFAERIEATCKRVWQLLESDFPTSIDDFSKLVRNARNYYTHYSTQSESMRPRQVDVRNAANWLTIVLELNFLMDLSLPDATLRDVVSGNRAYRSDYYGKWEEGSFEFL